MKLRRVLNFGAGTQSSYLYAAMCAGQIEPAEVAIFSDLGWEPAAVYEHLAWMESLNGVIPIVKLTAGNIRRDALVSQVRGRAAGGERWASMPLYTHRLWLPAEVDEFASIFCDGAEQIDEWSLFGTSYSGKLQYLTQLVDLRRGMTVEHVGMIRRQCTSEYKIAPIRRWIRENMLGLKPGERGPSSPVIAQVFGISFDERQRMKLSDERWAIFEYPLVEQRMVRSTVLERAAEMFPGRVFPRSACIGCPYHSNSEWKDMRDNRPAEWADAVEFDRAIRNCGGMRGQMYLHRSCVPLENANLEIADNPWLDGMANECEGMCGV